MVRMLSQDLLDHEASVAVRPVVLLCLRRVIVSPDLQRMLHHYCAFLDATHFVRASSPWFSMVRKNSHRGGASEFTCLPEAREETRPSRSSG